LILFDRYIDRLESLNAWSWFLTDTPNPIPNPNLIDTEIDWIAYMQEVKHYLYGERNYINIYGDTGPLVYPAGFLYVFSALYYVTNHGANIFAGKLRL
jgi:hypothetical protein